MGQYVEVLLTRYVSYLHTTRAWQAAREYRKMGAAAFQADKGDYRGVLAGLEGITGKKAINSHTMTVRN
jgi:hypothetical protein